MKKTLSFMVMAFALLFAQCRKPEVKFPTPSAADEGTTVSMTVTAGPGSKTDITTAGAITWSTGDKLYVGDGSKYIGYLTLQSGEGSATGTFSGSVSATAGDHTFGFYYLGSKDYSSELTTSPTSVDVDFSSQNIYADTDSKLANASKHHVGYGSAKGTVSGGFVTGINVTMVSKVAIAYFDFKNNDGTDYKEALTLSGTGIYNKMRVNFKSEGFACEGTKGGITLEAGHAERYVMLVPTSSTTGSQTLNFVVGDMTGSTKLENGIEANKFYGRDGAIPVTVKPKPKFSVAAGTTVEFAPGNLYYNGENDSHKMNSALPSGWNFYGSQWDCYPSVTASMEISLFTWGYGDWSTVYNTMDFQALGDMVDWGTAPGLPSAGEDKSWHTLSKAEWVWLLGPSSSPNPGTNCRTSSTISGTENARYAEVKVNGVKGLLIFPDVFAWPSGVSSLPSTFNTSSENWNGVNYNTADFGKLESAGVVFLPVAGKRMGESLLEVGSDGRYWSSSSQGPMMSCGLLFNYGSVNPSTKVDRCYGCSVRLVR